MSIDRPVCGIASVWDSLDEALIRWWTEQGSGRRNNTREHLGPFMKWCASNAIAPELVADETIVAYLATKTFEGQTHYRRHELYLRRSWNDAACRVRAWPAVSVSCPVYYVHNYPSVRAGHIVALAEWQYHEGLVAEVKIYCSAGGLLVEASDGKTPTHSERMEERLKLLSGPSGDRRRIYPARPLALLSKTTLYTQRRIIYMMATALHLAGEADLSELNCIANVVTVKGAALLADAYERRLGPTKGKAAAARCVRYFHSIAVRCGLIFNAAEREAIRDLQHDLDGRTRPIIGISERNLRNLAQFDDPKIFSMLIALPEVLMQELERERKTHGRTT